MPLLAVIVVVCDKIGLQKVFTTLKQSYSVLVLCRDCIGVEEGRNRCTAVLHIVDCLDVRLESSFTVSASSSAVVVRVPSKGKGTGNGCSLTTACGLVGIIAQACVLLRREVVEAIRNSLLGLLLGELTTADQLLDGGNDRLSVDHKCGGHNESGCRRECQRAGRDGRCSRYDLGGEVLV